MYSMPEQSEGDTYVGTYDGQIGKESAEVQLR